MLLRLRGFLRNQARLVARERLIDIGRRHGVHGDSLDNLLSFCQVRTQAHVTPRFMALMFSLVTPYRLPKTDKLTPAKRSALICRICSTLNLWLWCFSPFGKTNVSWCSKFSIHWRFLKWLSQGHRFLWCTTQPGFLGPKKASATKLCTVRVYVLLGEPLTNFTFLYSRPSENFIGVSILGFLRQYDLTRPVDETSYRPSKPMTPLQISGVVMISLVSHQATRFFWLPKPSWAS